MKTTETRNSSNVMTDIPTHPSTEHEGVGGRQRQRNLPQWGGGYLDVYSKTALLIYGEMLADNRLDELREHGLGDIWIEVAEAIGYDSFIHIWQILDQKNSNFGHHDNARIRVPIFSQFLKFQRNKYIISLSKNGKNAENIKILLKKELCEELTVGHINRVIGKSNLKE